jgi:hypothetical protein
LIGEPANLHRQAVGKRHKAAEFVPRMVRIAHDGRTFRQKHLAAAPELLGMASGRPFGMRKQQHIMDESDDGAAGRARSSNETWHVSTQPK